MRTALLEGARGGAILGVCAVILAVLGLSPSLIWIPEVPLLATAAVVPLIVLGLTGYRVAQRDGSRVPAAVAGGFAGAVGGAVGGAAYVAFGKPLLNVAVGLVVGTAGGVICGALGAAAHARAGRGPGPG